MGVRVGVGLGSGEESGEGQGGRRVGAGQGRVAECPGSEKAGVRGGAGRGGPGVCGPGLVSYSGIWPWTVPLRNHPTFSFKGTVK